MNRRLIQHARARRSLAAAAIVFLLVQVGLFLVMEYFAPDLRDPSYESRLASFRKRNAAQPNAVSIACFGSSHVLYGLEEQLLESRLSSALGRPVVVGSFGYLAAGPVTNLLYAARLLDDGQRPDLVIVEVMPLFMGDEKDMSELFEARLPSTILRRDEVSRLAGYCEQERPWGHARWWLSQIPPISVYRAQILPRIAPRWACIHDPATGEYDECGGSAIRFTEPDPARLRLDLQLYQSRFRRESAPGERQCRAIGEVIERCRAAGVPVALMLTPEHAQCRAAYGATNWAMIDQFLTDTQRREGVPVVIARDWLHDDLFLDGHHPLAAGVQQFTDRLAQESVAPLLEREFAARSSTALRR